MFTQALNCLEDSTMSNPVHTSETRMCGGYSANPILLINTVVGGAIDMRFMPAILKGVMEKMERGPLTGSYARDVRVIVYDGKMHPVDSNELSFMLAARNAFSEAFKNAGPKILEPIYDLEVYVPADCMGDVMSDLQGRRALIMGMDSENGYQKLQAKIPLKELSCTFLVH